MTLKTKLIISTVVVVGSFAAGRFTATTKVVEEKTVVTEKTEKKEEKKNERRERNKKTTVTEVTRPDGTRERRVERVEKDVSGSTETTKTDVDTNISEKSRKEITAGGSTVNISALGVVSVTSLSIPVYGASITKQIIGPFTLGILGLTSGQIGVSLGINL